MARPATGRVTKRSSGRLRNRSSVGFEGFLTAPHTEGTGPSDMEIASSALEPGEDLPLHRVPRAALVLNTQQAEPMVFEGQENPATSLLPRDKGKGRAVEAPEEKPFDFMDLPAELRLEIYRACLTRPYNILLAKYIEPPPEPAEPEDEDESDAELDMDDSTDGSSTWVALGSMRAARGLNSRNRAISTRPRQSRPSTAGPYQVIHRRRQSHTVRFSSGRATSLLLASSSAGSDSNPSATHWIAPARAASGHQSLRPSKQLKPSSAKSDDPLIVNILRLNKTIYKEARSLLYSENIFDLSIDSAVASLALLHQRSRRLIRQVELEIPSYTEIQDNFSEVVRLSLRYCTGLRKLIIHTPFCLPGGDGTATPNSNTQIWAQGFDILRWLPQTCEVELKGHKNPEIDEVVNKHLHLAKTLSPVAYAHRQLIPSDSGSHN